MKETLGMVAKNYKKIVWMAVPIAMQNLVTTALSLIDTLMIGRLGEEKIAAVGIANQYFFILILLLFGINSGISIFISQFWGSKETGKIKKTLGLGIFSGIAFALVFAIGGILFTEPILGIFTKDTGVVREGAVYMRIVSFSLAMLAVTLSYSIASRSIGNPKLPLAISALSLVVNTVLNLFLIFGIGPFPALGVKGAAIATLISRFFEMVLTVLMISRKGIVISASIKELFEFDFIYIKTVYRKIWPVIMNEGIWAVGMSLYVVAYGRMGTDEFAAVRISETVMNIFFIAAVGLGNAGAVITGNLIGEKSGEVRLYANRLMKLSVASGLLLGIVMYASSGFVPLLFNVSGQVREMAKHVLCIYGAMMPVKFLNNVYVIGLFRGGGDTKFSLFLELGSIYLIGVPLAFAGALYWGLPLHMVVVLVNLEEVGKTIVGYSRIRTDKWINDLTGA